MSKKDGDKSQKNKITKKNQKKWITYFFSIVIPALMVLLAFYWPKIHKFFIVIISISPIIQGNSTILLDGRNINLNIKASVTNDTEYSLKISEFGCFARKESWWVAVPWTNQKGKELRILNTEPLNDDAKQGFIRPRAFGDYDLYFNLPLPDHIREIEKLWKENKFQLTYQDLLDSLKLPLQEVVITVQTNPVFKDEAVLKIFSK